MAMAFRAGTVCDIESAKHTLAQLIRQAFEHIGRAEGRLKRAVRVEAPIEPLDPLEWLVAQGNRSRGYWADRRKHFELAGVGTADFITAPVQSSLEDVLDQLHRAISEVHPNLRYLGGMRFDSGVATSPEWERFGAYRFVLPRFELLRRGSQSYFACNIVLGGAHGDISEQALLNELEDLPFPTAGPSPAEIPAIRSRTESPGRAEWAKLIGEALDELDTDRLEKVVLARKTHLEFEKPLDPAVILQRLAANTGNCFHFCFQPHADAAFIGASPERLFKRQGRYVETEVLAGTRACGNGMDTDQRLGEELLGSEKDQREHAIVVKEILPAMEARCHAVHMDSEPDLVRLSHCQHLRTRLEGILSSSYSDADLLCALHPTPAVGGRPRETARTWISGAEPFDRGWYAGPVGWVSCDAAEFAVGIRSALIHGDAAELYAGAGIVRGSDANAEWDELDQKTRSFLRVLEPDAD